MYAIFNKSTGRVVGKFYGEESQIGNRHELEKFGYLTATEADVGGNPDHYFVDNGVIKRRNVEEVISEIEARNPVFKLQKENSLLYSALAEMSILSAQQEQENIETQNAIAELSMLVAVGGV